MNEIYRPGLKRSWFNLAMNEENQSADIYLYNDIGFFGVSANDFKEQLLSLNAKDLNVYINSMGGEVADGMAIYNLLKRHNGKKTVHIDGMAASIASVIAMAGDEIIMPDTALMFLHQPWTITAGNAQDLQHTAEQLQKTEATIVAAYAEKTGRDAAFISGLLKDETTLTASEAVDMGFADKLKKDEPVSEFAYSGAMMNRVLCQMVKKNGVKNMTEIQPEPPAAAPAVEPIAEPVAEIPAVEPEQPVVKPVAEPDTVAAKAEPEQIDARAEFKQFVARFGAVRAAAYFAEGLAFADAERRFTDELIAENADLRARNQAVEQVRPVAVQPKDESAKPVEFTRAQITKMSKSEYAANKDAINKAQAEGRIK